MPLACSALQLCNALILHVDGSHELLLLLKAQLLHLGHFLLVALASRVRFEGSLAAEKLVGWQAEELHLVRRLLPAQDVLVCPALLKLLVKLLLKLLDSDDWLRAEQEASQVLDDALQIICVFRCLVLTVPRDVVELVKLFEPLNIIQFVELLLYGLLHYRILGLKIWSFAFQPCECLLSKTLCAMRPDFLYVEILDEMLMHVDALPHVFLSREEGLTPVCFKSPKVKPLRIL
mmetsp:Transcript_42423/g.79623  ORF Transcript_42423/g.79623 Transcript_42423/m.79623 type:complete len:233 (-) Transcript_42423:458-1156(-)